MQLKRPSRMSYHVTKPMTAITKPHLAVLTHSGADGLPSDQAVSRHRLESDHAFATTLLRMPANSVKLRSDWKTEK